MDQVGRPSRAQPGSWSLQPNQYSKIKLGAGQWPYTYAEQQQVIQLAHAAFDELDLPANAEERMEFEKKERDASNAFANRSSDESEKNTPQLSNTATLQSNAVTLVREREKARTESPSPVMRQKVPTKRGPQSKIAKERAKFVAERQRAGTGSLPNIKGPNGIASPRLGPTASPSVSPEKKDSSKYENGEYKEKEMVRGKERKDEKEKERRREEKKDREREKEKSRETESSAVSKAKRSQTAYDYSSDEGAASNQIEVKATKTKGVSHEKIEDSPREKPVPLAEIVQKREKRGRKVDYSDSSEEEGEIRGRPKAKITSDDAARPNKHKRRDSESRRKPSQDRNDSNKRDAESRRIGDNLRTQSQQSKSSRETFLHRSPPEMTVNLASRRSQPADPEALRDRYEELYPAYNLLANKLSKIHQMAESGEEVGSSEAEIKKMVGKWEKWHKELTEIRRWFGEV